MPSQSPARRNKSLSEKIAVTTTEVENSVGRFMGKTFSQNACEDSDMAHEKVEPTQITPRSDRARVRRRQRIKQFGLKLTLHDSRD